LQADKQKEMTKKRLAITLAKRHPGGMPRSVEPPIAILCIPSGMHPSMTALDRFTAHQPTMDGMHSAGMQPEGGAGGFSTERRIPPGCNGAEVFFVGLSLAGSISGKQINKRK
jgi:hypothetical protein